MLKRSILLVVIFAILAAGYFFLPKSLGFYRSVDATIKICAGILQRIYTKAANGGDR